MPIVPDLEQVRSFIVATGRRALSTVPGACRQAPAVVVAIQGVMGSSSSSLVTTLDGLRTELPMDVAADPTS